MIPRFSLHRRYDRNRPRARVAVSPYSITALPQTISYTQSNPNIATYTATGWGILPALDGSSSFTKLNDGVAIPYDGTVLMGAIWYFADFVIALPDIKATIVYFKGTHVVWPTGFAWTDSLYTYSSATTWTSVIPQTIDGEEITGFWKTAQTTPYYEGVDYSPVITTT